MSRISKKIVMMSVDEIKIPFFVRTQLDDDRVIFFGQLYENQEKDPKAEKLPPIKVTEDGRLWDGRHRLAAQTTLLDRKKVECEITPNKDNSELILMAFQANSGGAKPPTQKDTEHTIQLLLVEGVPQHKIVESFPFPPSLVRKFIRTVKDAMAKAQLRKAVNEVAEGEMSATEAAAKYGVDAEKLKTHLRGTKKKIKTNLGEITSNMTQMARSHSQKVAKILARVQTALIDGEITSSHAKKVLKKATDLNQQNAKSLEDWGKRIEAIITSNKK